MNKKKIIINFILLAMLFSITICAVFSDQDMGKIFDYLEDANGNYWIVCIGLVVLFILGEAGILFYLLRVLKQKCKPIRCIMYSFVGFFFSGVTPSASGGQPMQIFFMKRDRISIGVSTQILMIVTIAYKAVLVLIGAATIIFRPHNVVDKLDDIMGWCYLGIVLNVAFIICILVIMLKSSWAEKLIIYIVKLLNKLHIIKNVDAFNEKVKRTMANYHMVAAFFKEHKLVIANVFVITFVQRICFFFITYLVYKSFGLSGESVITIVTMQAMISLAVDMLPLPGGVGMHEALFISIFTPIFGKFTLPAMIVCRGLSYYTQIILSAIMTGVAYISSNRNEMKSKSKSSGGALL